MKKVCYFLVFIFYTYSCVEPYEAATQVFENSLIVEATLTNEHKIQKVLLSRTYRLEEDEAVLVSNAVVKVVDDLQNEYVFQEASAGIYLSTLPFAAVSERTYQLKIITDTGNYESFSTKLTTESSDLNIQALKTTNEDGIEGVQITANSFTPSGNAKYYRFEYEETYKVVAPYWTPLDAFGVSPFPTLPGPVPSHEVYTLPRTQEEETCYRTDYSTIILQEETNKFAEDKVQNYPVLFLPKTAFPITHRYSILVRQYVQSFEAYSFYKTLNQFSNQESLLSQNQPGFISGNLYAVGNSEEKVIGYFAVSSALTKRIFFNFEDFFPDDEKPPYITDCPVITPQLTEVNPTTPGAHNFSPLISLLINYDYKFVGFNEPFINVNTPYFVVKRECGDCTALGSNIIPDFWVD